MEKFLLPDQLHILIQPEAIPKKFPFILDPSDKLKTILLSARDKVKKSAEDKTSQT